MDDALRDKAADLIRALLGVTRLRAGKSPNIEVTDLIEKEYGNHIAFTAMEVMDLLWPDLAYRRETKPDDTP